MIYSKEDMFEVMFPQVGRFYSMMEIFQKCVDLDVPIWMFITWIEGYHRDKYLRYIIEYDGNSTDILLEGFKRIK